MIKIKYDNSQNKTMKEKDRNDKDKKEDEHIEPND